MGGERGAQPPQRDPEVVHAVVVVLAHGLLGGQHPVDLEAQVVVQHLRDRRRAGWSEISGAGRHRGQCW